MLFVDICTSLENEVTGLKLDTIFRKPSEFKVSKGEQCDQIFKSNRMAMFAFFYFSVSPIANFYIGIYIHAVLCYVNYKKCRGKIFKNMLFRWKI
jgi:hypothetical protein